ncbi:MAG: DUF4198 domain-containing protein [Polaromonas sp.]
MKIIRSCIALIILLVTATHSGAHEFWLEPVAPVVVGSTAPLTLRVGEFFEGDLVGFSTAQTVAIRQYVGTESSNLRAMLPLRNPVATLALPLTTAGAHMVVFDSQPSMISLPAGKFEAYLHDEGLDFITARRQATGASESPGRERYRRFVKTLISAVPAPAAAPVPASSAIDMTYATRSGQRLEMVPLADPLLTLPGESLGIRVLFEEKPLAGALLKAWHRHDDQTVMIRAKTSADGTASFNLPFSGAWMISVVHMIPATGTKDIDWDSLWGNISFSVPPAGSKP